jgi:hypothetical protein
LELARCGHRVTILRDFSNLFENAPHTSVTQSLDHLLSALPAEVKVLDVARLPVISNAGDSDLAAKILQENAIWKMRGESRSGEFLGKRPESFRESCKHLGRIRHLCSTGALDWLLVPGGIWGLSAMYLAIGRQHGVGVSTYDSDPGTLLLAHDGVAAHHADLPESFDRLRASLRKDPEAEEKLVQMAHAELTRRMEGKDDFGFQNVCAGKANLDFGSVLIPLNLRWDSAALSRNRLFSNVADWLSAVVRWMELRPQVRLCIRQHPCERVPEVRGTDDVTGVWQQSPARERVTYVAATDPVSSYDLLRTARVVLPYTSTVGIEATMLGLPVIVSTDCYYANLGFVWNAGSIDEYFARLEEALNGQLAVSATARRQAALVYLLGQQWAQMRTFFTPTPADFLKWAIMPPEELWDLPEVQDLRDALSSRIPLSFLRFQRAFAICGK